jgi:dTDP-4-amino-4,6-dideoxygalactose transaminase
VIQLIDLKANVATIREEVDRAIAKVIDDTAFILGPAVERFEKTYADYIGVRHAIGLQSGTAALQLALMAAGVGPGHEVITAPSSFFATAEAISLVGARPVFVDVEPDTLNLDASKLEGAIGPKTRAIVPVHLYGQAADMAPISEIAARHNLVVIEDACQAHGATYGDRRLGSLGLAGVFSFYPSKNLGAFGEGGAVTTNDDALAAKIRRLRDHGSPEKHRHTMIGFNYRLEGIQGAVLGVKLPYLDGWNEARRRLAARYDAKLSGLGDLQLPPDKQLGRHVYHLYAVRSVSRARIFDRFAERNIVRASHYPIPIHLQDAYVDLGYRKGSFPVAEAAADQTFSLPLYPELALAQQDQVIEALVAAFT